CVGHLYVAGHQAGHAGRGAWDEQQICIQPMLLVKPAILSQVPDGVAALQSAVRKSDLFLSPGRIQKAEAGSKKYDTKPKFPWKPHDTLEEPLPFFFLKAQSFPRRRLRIRDGFARFHS